MVADRPPVRFEGCGFGNGPALTGSTHTPGASVNEPDGQGVPAVLITVVVVGRPAREDAFTVGVTLFEGVAARPTTASTTPNEPSMNASKARRLNMPD